MKRLTNIFCLALLCTAVACNDASTSSEATKTDSSGAATTTAAVADETPTMKDTATLNTAMMDYGTLGQAHAALAKDNGAWDTEITYWMTPDAPPMKMTGTATNKMILGGHYQQQSFKGDMMGMPFEGISTLAYDNAKKAYVTTWIDNMSTGLMVLEGKMDAATKTINFTGKGVDYRNGKDVAIRQTYQLVDDNTQYMEMYMTYPGGKEYKSMEMTYKRKK